MRLLEEDFLRIGADRDSNRYSSFVPLTMHHFDQNNTKLL